MVDEDIVAARLEPLVEAEVDGELMALSVERGVCYGFNATATEVWRLIEQPRTLGSLCDEMMRRHEVDRATCRADLAAMLRGLADQGLVSLTAAR